MPENIIYLTVLAAGASFVQRTIGFGFGIFIMTALPFLMPSYGEAVTLSGLLSLTSASVVMLKYLKHVNWKRLWPIAGSFALFSTIAICLLDRIEGRAMRIVLGIMLILISLYFSFFKSKIQKLIRPTAGWMLGTGAASGIMGGLFGMHGPPVVLYLTVSEHDKDSYMGMIQTYAVITNIMMLAVRSYSGYATAAVGTAYIYALAGLVAGVLAGSWAYRHIPNRIFTYIVYAYIGISGLIILMSS